ncbi:MAG TPA: Crp/Fnr family transcriptional regulator [Anaerolineales bacterium]|jgi:CRP-like cAMP-binding protein
MSRQKSPVRLDWLDPEVCSLDYRLKIIGRLPFFKHLTADAIGKINGLFHDRDVATDERVYFEGDDADNLYLVAMGKVKLMRNTGTGREVLLNILHSGEDFGTVGVFSGHKYTETAIAQTDCCILQISSADFESILADYPEVTRKVLGVVSLRLAESQEVVKQLSTYPVEQRIAAALMRLAEGLGEIRGKDVLIQLPFSRQDLAAMTGATTETVSRVMSRFIEDGLIKSGRKWVLITDRQRLDEMAKSGAVN